MRIRVHAGHFWASAVRACSCSTRVSLSQLSLGTVHLELLCGLMAFRLQAVLYIVHACALCADAAPAGPGRLWDAVLSWLWDSVQHSGAGSSRLSIAVAACTPRKLAALNI